MINNLYTPGPYLDNLIAKIWGVHKSDYSTNYVSAMHLLRIFTKRTDNCGFEMHYDKQINSEHCTVNIINNDINYIGKSGNIPTAICLAFIDIIKKKTEGAKSMFELYRKNKGVFWELQDYYKLTQQEIIDILNHE